MKRLAGWMQAARPTSRSCPFHAASAPTSVRAACQRGPRASGRRACRRGAARGPSPVQQVAMQQVEKVAIELGNELYVPQQGLPRFPDAAAYGEAVSFITKELGISWLDRLMVCATPMAHEAWCYIGHTQALHRGRSPWPVHCEQPIWQEWKQWLLARLPGVALTLTRRVA